LIANSRYDDAKKVLRRGRIFFPFSKNIKERLKEMESVQFIGNMKQDQTNGKCPQ
jgi:hypothetical protein